jgi:hypothetical protein
LLVGQVAAQDTLAEEVLEDFAQELLPYQYLLIQLLSVAAVLVDHYQIVMVEMVTTLYSIP